MRKLLVQTIVCILTLFCFYAPLNSQVTIGSSEQPVVGALLDLKQSGTTTKGLGLPRVKLVKQTHADISLTIDGVTAGAYAGDHTGLLVYNTNKCLSGSGIDDGLHVWDGQQWIPLQQTANSANVQVFIDARDGERYKYSQFGTAGTWMLENMRAISYEQGSPAPINTGVAATTVKQYLHPHKGGNMLPVDHYYKQNPTMGLLYNWAAAVNYGSGVGEIIVAANLNEGQGGADEHAVRRQGICPQGWHIPSDREWNELEKEIYENAEKYSRYTRAEVIEWNTATPWDPAWETSTDSRPNTLPLKGAGSAIKAGCSVPETSATTTDEEIGGFSLASSQGGFNVYLTGYFMPRFGTFHSYGSIVNIWTASSGLTVGANPTAYSRSVSGKYNPAPGYDPVISRGAHGRETLLSVRCKMTPSP